ncbi:hypothetical protein N8678_00495 [bacterium]|nr:hypothetical protein [bacterium]
MEARAREDRTRFLNVEAGFSGLFSSDDLPDDLKKSSTVLPRPESQSHPRKIEEEIDDILPIKPIECEDRKDFRKGG